ncbi:MAG: hypothetical protein Q8781_01620 [Candidatus Phytoplasma stylosanthis]|uniref:hypothetical protein n=1 Tax=Candidatus Phytoplasma stylosanthis TaxID=2798314 RepID=UPI0029395583|nr:hypothetical protein [Candidatus Phytoplasma stylosanthis]MDV3168108.1 hypothetical protein [Candidatus Phytoplasma stylosanthis]MDV3170983.1 hypothetical protein [Candidatus Phytoplasma stylosanthis]MDV3173788.1 hypothetical protein [Candidatus Phytoplasma stylosanthis]MDV3174299.1 hypothetical protein [Candidatus Phytoplasma stylosanthis]MDV3202482.1 hypothetical protein [Candidatus Phytoplasma stylosanthis]
MNIYNKFILFFQKKNVFHLSKDNKYFRFFVIFLGFIGLLIIISFNLKRDVYDKNEPITFKNVFQKSFIEKKQNLHDSDFDSKKSEKTIVGLKAMWIGVIIFIIYLGLKKGLIGISLGTFIGACFGIWLFILYPSFFYFLELIYKKIFNV